MANTEAGKNVETSGDLSKYIELYDAAISGNWETANTRFFEKNPEVIEAVISFEGETALHIAAQSGRENDFVQKLVALMSPQALALRDRNGYTGLHKAAMVGNTEAATTMLEKSLDLLDVKSDEGLLAVTVAAQYSQKGTLEYLISKSKLDVENSPFKGNLGIDLLIEIIRCEFFDIALDLVEKYPDLAKLTKLGLDNSQRCALSYMADMRTVFPSIHKKKNLADPRVPPEQHESGQKPVAGDIEDPTSKGSSTSSQIDNGDGKHLKGGMIRKVMKYLACSTQLLTVPRVTKNKDKKEKHNPALELAKCLCHGMKSLPENDARNMLQESMFRAAEHGVSDIVQMIMEIHPFVTASVDGTGKNIMHLAVRNRFQGVFNLTYNMGDRKHLFSNGVDYKGNNLLHMCAQLAPPKRLNLVRGAALQMQRELLWFNIIFQEIQRFVPRSRVNSINKNGKTPKMLFTEEHKDLKEQGEKWMKDTANACSITAALIATVMFAAAFTAPGGLLSETGIPVLSKDQAFKLFSAATVYAFFFSITSLMMFLSVITSRYAEEDFLLLLPTKLSIGLLLLYISITCMVISFGAAISFLFRPKITGFYIFMASFGWCPIMVFVQLQAPIHLSIISSTLGLGIFGKRSTADLLY